MLINIILGFSLRQVFAHLSGVLGFCFAGISFRVAVMLRSFSIERNAAYRLLCGVFMMYTIQRLALLGKNNLDL
jgi:hypothetical protein